MKIVDKAVAILTLFAAASTIHAGRYVAGLTSGLIATSAPGGVQGPFYGNGSCSVPSAGGGNGTGTIGGTLTTVFTWVKDKDANGNDIAGDLPPVNVIILESCSVLMDAKAYPGSPTASANNGLDPRFCTNTSGTSTIFYPIPAPPYMLPIGTDAGATLPEPRQGSARGPTASRSPANPRVRVPPATVPSPSSSATRSACRPWRSR